MLVIGIPLLFVIFLRSNVDANDGYLIVAPSVFRPGVEELISITILHPSVPITVEAKLTNQEGDILSLEGREIFGKGSLNLKVPIESKGLAQLKICGNCLSTDKEEYSFYNASAVMIEERGSVLFIDTDKPIYKPGQTVYITAITTGIDLKPTKEKFALVVEDGHGTRIAKWPGVPETCSGIYQVYLPLSVQPVLGKWIIRSELKGHEYNRTFTVEKYTLPKYAVDIHPPPFIKDWSLCHEFAVSARYVYRKDVQGNLTVSVTLKGLGYYKDYLGKTEVLEMPIIGTAVFNVCLADLIHNEVSEHFRGHLQVEAEVATPGGRSVSASDGTCAVNKQLVDVAFSPDNRKHFKPGIPYRGKVNVMNPDGSSAENVTILIRTDVNSGNFSAKIYDVTSGKVQFEIPELPLDANIVWIEAQVLKVEGRNVIDTYLSSHMSITGWYSPSNCHLLVESDDAKFEVGKHARFHVLSTCPCNVTLYFEVISRGNIVNSGIHFSHHHDKREVEVRFEEEITEEESLDGLLCNTHFKFTVTHKMAPLSRLLVYYVRENGEGVADATTLHIEPSFENKLTLSSSIKETLPGERLELIARSMPSSCVCLTATDKSMYYQTDKGRLSKDMIFDEMEEFDVTLTNEDEQEPYWWGLSNRHRRSEDYWRPKRNKDAKYAFEEAGMLVLTDKVRLHHGKDLGSISSPIFHRPGYLPVEALDVFMRRIKHTKKFLRKRRTYFPETWFRRCFNTSSTRKSASFWTKVPDSITTWVVDGFSMSPKDGLAVAKSIEVTTFKRFFMDMVLPYSIVRGEQVRVPVNIHNHFDYCTEVYVNIKAAVGVTLAATKSNSQRFGVCIGKNRSASKSIVASFDGLGMVNITAVAEAYPSLRCCYGTPTTQWSIIRRKVIGYDHVTKEVLSVPEGVAKEYTNSVFFCPKERLHLSTPSTYEYQYLPKPKNVQSFTFAVKAARNVHVALSNMPRDNDKMAEVVLGGEENTLSYIAIGKGGLPLVAAGTPNLLSEDEYRYFWISWDQNIGKIGSGLHIGNNSFLALELQDGHQTTYIGFSTSGGSEGNFKIWSQSDTEGTYGEVFHLGIPANHIPGSARAQVKLVGDVLGPTMQNLERLLRLPHGCGEQNMVYFAPNIHVLKYLKQTAQLKPEVESRAIRMLVEGYQRQLTFLRWDGSYSAFGNKDSTGSMWLTTFVLQSFLQSREFIYIDPENIEKTKNWILSQQSRDGSFASVGRVINKEIQSGEQGVISLTAYVLTSLLEINSEEKIVTDAINLAKEYLELKVTTVSDPYTAALCSYALSLMNSDQTIVALRKLNQMALATGGLMFWKISERPLQKDVIFTFQDGLTKTVSSAEVEVAAYALLTYSIRGDVASALPVVKWLSRKRNAWGGFSSTHDTSLALYALSKYAILVYSGKVNMTVTLASTNLDLQKRMTVHPGNCDLVQTVAIPSLPTGLFVSAVGDGCALLQIEVNYNVPDPSKRASFHLTVKLAESEGTDRGANNHQINLEVCSRWMHAGSSNMAVIEVSLLSGFEADTESLDYVLEANKDLKRYETVGDKIIFYFSEISNRCRTCLSFRANQILVVGKTRPAIVKVYDYYEPAYETATFYSVGRGSALTEELCDEIMCNKINGKSENDSDHTSMCSSEQGCEESPVSSCSCHEDCTDDKSPVCGSDGAMHDGICRMKMTACERATSIEEMDIKHCLNVTTDESNNGVEISLDISRDILRNGLEAKTDEVTSSERSEQ